MARPTMVSLETGSTIYRATVGSCSWLRSNTRPLIGGLHGVEGARLCECECELTGSSSLVVAARLLGIILAPFS